MNLDDAPIATRLRSRDKEVDASQARPNGVTGSKYQADKKSQHLTRHSNRSEIMGDSEVHISSSSLTIGQNRSRKLSEGPNKSNGTKSHSKNHDYYREKRIIANKRFGQPKSEANNASSSSQVPRDQKMKNNVRLSEESSKNRHLEDADDLPVVEPHPCYIRCEESQRHLLGWTCELCEKDVGVSPFGEEGEDSYLYPEVSVFPCGHVYHSSCLQRFQSGDQDLTHGPCIFCLSLSSQF